MAAALPTVTAATFSLAPLVATPAAGPGQPTTVMAAARTPSIPVNRTRGGLGVGKGLFGMHMHSATAWPRTAGGAALPVGFERIWDDKATWRDIQPTAPNLLTPDANWKWSRLDQQVATASTKNSYIEVTLGQTPQWASSKPSEIGDWYGAGAAAPPLKDSLSGTY